MLSDNGDRERYVETCSIQRESLCVIDVLHACLSRCQVIMTIPPSFAPMAASKPRVATRNATILESPC
jgi:hypothetical protein